jgi:hypothetical protein
MDSVNRPATWLYITDAAHAAITMKTGSRLERAGFYYPNQTWNSGASTPGTAYPATIALDTSAIVRHATIRDIFFENAYQGFDFTAKHERLYVENIHGYAISLGLDLDGGSDIDMFIGVEFNINGWSQDPNRPADIYTDWANWTWHNGIGFRVRRTDWSEFHECGAFGYKTGADFEPGVTNGGVPSNIRWTGGFFDGCQQAVLANAASGLRFIGTTFDAYNWDPGDFSGSGTYCVRLGAIDGASFIGCNFFTCSTFALLSFTSRQLIVKGCFFSQWGLNGGTAHSQPAIQIHSDTANNRRCVNVIVGNVFQWHDVNKSSTAQDGIELMTEGGTKYTSIIDGNVFDNIGGNAITVDSGADDYRIGDNSFMRCAAGITKGGTPVNGVEDGNLYVDTTVPTDYYVARRYAPSITSRTTQQTETFPRYAVGSTIAPAAGQIDAVRIHLFPGSYTKMSMYVATAGATLVNTSLGIYDVATGTLQASSVDLSSNLGGAASDSVFAGTLNFTVPSEQDYWLCVLVGSAVTMPVLGRSVQGGGGLWGLAPELARRHSTTGLTALPGTLSFAAGGSGRTFWFRYE